MNEEEAKAIENLKHTLKISDELFEEVGDRLIDTSSSLQIETVLNLIEKQKAEIKDKQDEINVLEAQKESIENQFEQAKKEVERVSSEFAIGKRQYKELVDDYEKLNKKNINQQKEIEKKDKIINSIKEYAQQEINFATEDIEDYIDDDREGNKNIIGELKEWREHWKDIIRIMNNEKTYMDFEYKVEEDK